MSQRRSFSAASRGVASGLAVLVGLGATAAAAGAAGAQSGDVAGAGSIQAAGVGAAKTSGNSIALHVPSHVKLHKQFSYSVTGTRTGKANRLAAVLDTKACAASLKGEDARFPSKDLKTVRFVWTKLPKSFKANGAVKANTTGKHHICAYLFNKKTQKTFAHASATYTTSK